MKLSKVFHRNTRTGLPLALEITIFLLIKLCALWVIWKLFFSQPHTKKMQLPVQQVEQHLLEPAAEKASSSANKKNTTLQTSSTERTSP